jgi:hypothetical protein
LYAVDCMDPISTTTKYYWFNSPRPANYDYNSELFNRKLALLLILWQQLNPLSRFRFYLTLKRLNRLVEYQAENNGLGIDDDRSAFKIWNQKKPKVWKD